eukprot:TRINITY_DN2798_c0_g1_i1.p1 TRINITY_DN2798_c0_g1~~TRINITY_DN2798_c0_g1_i1.p1  ORF type:complete len:526 (+),score=90.94 TRINITY_DN2798_c0_g1_i1:93-1580(+)
MAFAKFITMTSTSNKNAMTSRNYALLAAGILFAVLPFETEHLLTMISAALAYAAWIKLQPKSPVKPRQRKQVEVASAHVSKGRRICEDEASRRPGSALSPQPHIPVLTVSMKPVAAPVFQSMHWDAEVTELLTQITPSAQCEQTVKQLGRMVKRALLASLPEADVTCFTSGNLKGGKAFGVAVPDVDIVIDVNPSVMSKRFENRNSRSRSAGSLDMRQLQKFALRSCTECLTSKSGIKFRRSAFRGDEPKVTFLTPVEVGVSDVAVPFDLSVNSVSPMRSAAILTESGRIEPRAQQLIILVRRWAKDRGICHAARGHLSPYMWTLLVVYFLQVGTGEMPLLPPLESFEIASRLMANSEEKNPRTAWVRQDLGRSVASLFKAFFSFYSDGFDWSKEAINVRKGIRTLTASPPVESIIEDESGKSLSAPSIEDPFGQGQYLAGGMTAWSLQRLTEELQRARGLCAKSDEALGSLAELLQPWAPSAADATADATADAA